MVSDPRPLLASIFSFLSLFTHVFCVHFLPPSVTYTLRNLQCKNIVHGSDSVESAKREIGLWFAPDELCKYSRAIDTWIYE
jgi:Nucleoside diphosphate kinase